jgi:hypothetical protein
LQSFETGDFDELRDRVEFLIGFFIVIAFAGESNTDARGNILDPMRPNIFVQFGMDPYVFGLHDLLRKLFNFFHGAWGPAFELQLVDAFTQMDRVVTGDQVGLLDSGSFHHCDMCLLLLLLLLLLL